MAKTNDAMMQLLHAIDCSVHPTLADMLNEGVDESLLVQAMQDGLVVEEQAKGRKPLLSLSAAAEKMLDTWNAKRGA